MFPFNNIPTVLAWVYPLISPLPPKLKRKRAISDLRSCIAQHPARATRRSELPPVSEPSGNPILTIPSKSSRPAPFPAGLPDPLRCQPPFPARKRRASRSRRRRAGFTKEEKAMLQHQLPVIAEEAHGDHGPVYELDASSQESVSSIVSVFELDASIQGSLSSIDPVYELEDTSSDNVSEASLPSIVVSDYEPIIETNRQLKQENQQMCAFLQEIITRDIIVKEQLDRARGECKAASAALNLLWELVKSNFDGSEHVATPAQIVEFLSTREIHDIPRLLQSGMKA
ncbi:hypothetical protein N8I77_001256 [Diaporthe amygdali]|uniref:Uncharacterized protein n=1 Tax=Phomopsis amygdali TaxID=1214568 RepID=A0AAD9SQK0_PHOAM|nr:hypothetical protein N8I77_001256 [Diaporthe amygdali]